MAKRRGVDVLTSRGQAVADAVWAIGGTEVTCHRWRRERGGLELDRVRRLEELELETGRRRRAVADLTLDRLVLAAARGHCVEPRVAFAPGSSI